MRDVFVGGRSEERFSDAIQSCIQNTLSEEVDKILHERVAPPPIATRGGAPEAEGEAPPSRDARGGAPPKKSRARRRAEKRDVAAEIAEAPPKAVKLQN